MHLSIWLLSSPLAPKLYTHLNDPIHSPWFMNFYLKRIFQCVDKYSVTMLTLLLSLFYSIYTRLSNRQFSFYKFWIEIFVVFFIFSIFKINVSHLHQNKEKTHNKTFLSSHKVFSTYFTFRSSSSIHFSFLLVFIV